MELKIQIEDASAPIRGVLLTGEPPVAQPFTGWMQLTELILAALERASGRPDERDG